MISLNTPLRSGSGELGDLIGVANDPTAAPDVADELFAPLARLRPLERALLVACHSDGLRIDEAAARIGMSHIAVTRKLRAAERKARGRKRSSGTTAPGAGVEVPVGTISVRQRDRRKARFIKLQMSPPRWEVYARWLWEQHRGPVPAGKLVLHRDGDTLNDALDNLVLGTHADRAFLFISRSEANYRKTFAACRAGCRRANRERAVARDLLGVIRAGLWYVVDHDRRAVVGPFGRKAHHAFEAIGVAPPPGTNTHFLPWLAAQLGWPGLPVAQALTLAVLARTPGRTRTQAEIAADLEPLAARLGQPVAATGTYMTQALYGARKRGLIASLRRGRHEITPTALGTRGAACLLAVLRGSQCQPFKEEGYAVLPRSAYEPAA